jgi:hypothetical protein
LLIFTDLLHCHWASVFWSISTLAAWGRYCSKTGLFCWNCLSVCLSVCLLCHIIVSVFKRRKQASVTALYRVRFSANLITGAP